LSSSRLAVSFSLQIWKTQQEILYAYLQQNLYKQKHNESALLATDIAKRLFLNKHNSSGSKSNTEKEIFLLEATPSTPPGGKLNKWH
jgi:hypothetical protein